MEKDAKFFSILMLETLELRLLSAEQIGAQGPADISRYQQNVRHLEDYLTSYAECNIPVLKTSLPEVSATADLLHDYLLECIALQWQ